MYCSSCRYSTTWWCLVLNESECFLLWSDQNEEGTGTHSFLLRPWKKPAHSKQVFLLPTQNTDGIPTTSTIRYFMRNRTRSGLLVCSTYTQMIIISPGRADRFPQALSHTHTPHTHTPHTHTHTLTAGSIHRTQHTLVLQHLLQLFWQLFQWYFSIIDAIST